MKTLAGILFPLVTLGIFVASYGYVAFRLRTAFGLKRRWPLRLAVTAVVTASMVTMLGTAKSTSATFGALNVLGGYLFSFHVFLSFLLVLVHPLSSRWHLSSRTTTLASLLVALLGTILGALEANSFQATEAAIEVPGLERELKVMQLSDVHLGHHRGRAYLEKVVTQTNQMRPDLVLLTGDLVDSHAALRPGVLAPLSKLEAPAFFVGGNHENYIDTERAFRLIAQQGVRVLRTEIVETNGIQLVGLDYLNPDEDTFDMHPSEDRRTIENVLPELSIAADRPVVLLHHSPVGAEYMAAHGVDLLIAGHTHGGQMFPGTLLASVVFRFNAGLYRHGDLQIYVSLGAGTFGPRMRLGTANEINLIHLKPGD